jgi:hypothetical protein
MGNNIGLSLWYEGMVKDGNKIIKHKKAKCHSFVENFLKFLNVQMAQTSVTATKITGVTGTNISTSMLLTSAIGTTSSGIWCGTSTAAVLISDYTLAAPIGHGTGAGQLQYSAVTFGAPSSTTSDTNFVVTRVMTNGSSGSITVNETGLVFNDGNGLYGLISRDIVTPFAVGVGQTLTLNYIFRTQI